MLKQRNPPYVPKFPGWQCSQTCVDVDVLVEVPKYLYKSLSPLYIVFLLFIWRTVQLSIVEVLNGSRTLLPVP